jgi:hypothetical protein
VNKESFRDQVKAGFTGLLVMCWSRHQKHDMREICRQALGLSCGGIGDLKGDANTLIQCKLALKSILHRFHRRGGKAVRI